MAKLELPVKVCFGEIDEIIKELRQLQTYKLFEGADEVLVIADEVMSVLACHVKVTTAEQKPGKWISVKDKVPDNQNPVIVSVPPHTNRDGDNCVGYVGMAYFTDSARGGFWCGTDGETYGAIGMIATPTHWMPLPEPEPYKEGENG